MAEEVRPKAYKQSVFYEIARLRLVYNYAIVFLAVIFTPDDLYLPALVIVAAGQAIRIASAGHITKRDKLAVSGPYAFTRNPLYLGSLVSGVGAMVLIKNPCMLGVFILGFIVFYGAAIRSEADYLAERHSEEFAAYKMSVPVLIPRLIPAKSVGESKFTWQSVIRNKEHKYLGFFLLALSLIFLKAWLI